MMTTQHGRASFLRSTRAPLALAALLGLVSGCDYTGDFLFAGAVPGVPAVWALQAPNGGPIVPAIVEGDTAEVIAANTIYAELGAPATTSYGGVTFEFIGTGDEVCIWVDPEVAFWSQALSPQPSENDRKWAYPDNTFDDGDLDLFVGQSVYYTGSPGETIGDFVVAYEDSLGNEIPISLAACPNQTGLIGEPASSGRGTPEFCSIPVTDLGISYTVVLRTWSTPLDDDRLSFGVLIVEGSCEDLRAASNKGTSQSNECLIKGEALTPIEIKDPEKNSAPVYYSFDDLDRDDRIWPNSMAFEDAFCGDDNMKRFCDDEVARIEEDGSLCEREVIDDPSNRCYCGDPNDSPIGGAF
jgi:hypothetical protein